MYVISHLGADPAEDEPNKDPYFDALNIWVC